MSRITDEMIETAAEKLLDGIPLTVRERRLLNSTQAHFAMGQVEAILAARKDAVEQAKLFCVCGDAMDRHSNDHTPISMFDYSNAGVKHQTEADTRRTESAESPPRAVFFDPLSATRKDAQR